MALDDDPKPPSDGAAKSAGKNSTYPQTAPENLVIKLNRESPEWAERLCRVGPIGVEGALFQNYMMIKEERSSLEGQTSFTVEELKSSVSYRGKVVLHKRVTALRGLRHLLLNFILVCQFLLLQPLVSASGSKAGNAAELFERVSQSVKMKHYSEALEYLNAAIEADPKFSEAYFHHASILRQQCRYEESEGSYKKFLELKPQDSVAEKELSQLHQAQSALDTAFTLFESGDYAKSLEYISKVVLVFSPACSKAKILKVRLLIATKDHSGAISESGYILKEDEDNLEALLLRGRAYYYLADYDVAIRHYQKGLRLDPEHSDLKKAYFGLKNLLKKTKSCSIDYVNKGKLRVAVEDFKAALGMDPDHLMHNVHLHLGLCKVLVKLGRGKEALTSCNEALNIDEELLDALVQRGEAKLLTEDWEGAVEDLKSSAQKSPQDMNIREALMRAEKALKLSKRKDWYKILGVSKTSSVAEIKRAYKKLALQWHPDKNVDNREEAEAQFREIAAAYEVLGDEEKRTRYDRGEDLEDMGMGGGGGGFNPFEGGGQQFTFTFEGGFPGGGFGGGFPGGGAGGGFDFHF